MKNIMLVIILSLTSVSCAFHNSGARASQNLTVGTVQKEIKLGMNSVKVAEALGSPNIVQTDDNRNEVWIYDKISTQVHQSSMVGGVWILSFVAGGSTSQRTTSDRTLTIIVKFDEASKVRDFAYHSSRF